MRQRADGRKRTINSMVFAVPERPLSGKADLQLKYRANSFGTRSKSGSRDWSIDIGREL